MDLKIGRLFKCQICNSSSLHKIISLGKISPCDSLLKKKDLSKKRSKYPLNLIRCKDCGLVQIDYVVNPKELFHKNYPYRSGITKDLRNNLEKISKNVTKNLKKRSNKLVIDIGSNDGSILKGFKKIGFKVLGIEPTNISKIANRDGIKTIQEFFSHKYSKKIKKKYGKASIITASNVFAHVSKLSDLLKGIHNLLDDDGLFISESHYLGSIIETFQFDSIYHEHLKYYSIKPLIELFERHNFIFEKVEKIPNYGGSIRVYARKKKMNSKIGSSVKKLLNEEIKKGLYKKKTYDDFSKKIRKFKLNFSNKILNLKRRNKKIIGIGCPGRAMTLLEYCNIDHKILDYIAEQNTSLKIGLYTPGTKIPVLDEKKSFDDPPDFAVMLSWHYSKSIIKNLTKKKFKPKIIIPLPKIKLVN